MACSRSPPAHRPEQAHRIGDGIGPAVGVAACPGRRAAGIRLERRLGLASGSPVLEVRIGEADSGRPDVDLIIWREPGEADRTGSPIRTSGGSTAMTASLAVLEAATDGATGADDGLGTDATGVGAAAEQPPATTIITTPASLDAPRPARRIDGHEGLLSSPNQVGSTRRRSTRSSFPSPWAGIPPAAGLNQYGHRRKPPMTVHAIADCPPYSSAVLRPRSPAALEEPPATRARPSLSDTVWRWRKRRWARPRAVRPARGHRPGCGGRVTPSHPPANSTRPSSSSVAVWPARLMIPGAAIDQNRSSVEDLGICLGPDTSGHQHPTVWQPRRRHALDAVDGHRRGRRPAGVAGS